MNTLLRLAEGAFVLRMASDAALDAAQSIMIITREFSASWRGPRSSGPGFGLKAHRAGSDQHRVAFWFTHQVRFGSLRLIGTGLSQGSRAGVQEFAKRALASQTFANAFKPSSLQV